MCKVWIVGRSLVFWAHHRAAEVVSCFSWVICRPLSILGLHGMLRNQLTLRFSKSTGFRMLTDLYIHHLGVNDLHSLHFAWLWSGLSWQGPNSWEKRRTMNWQGWNVISQPSICLAFPVNLSSKGCGICLSGRSRQSFCLGWGRECQARLTLLNGSLSSVQRMKIYSHFCPIHNILDHRLM